MPHVQTPTQSFTVTAASFATLTLTANTGSSVANLYKGLVGNLRLNTASTPVVVLAVESPGVVTLGVPVGSGQSTTALAVSLASYNGGVLYFESQPAYTTSSVESATNVALVTPTIDGVVSSAAKQQALAAVASDWGVRMRDLMYADAIDQSSGLSRLNGYHHEHYGGLYPGGVATALPSGVTRANIPGGGLQFTASAFVSANIVSNPKTTPWSLGFRAKFPAPTTAKYSTLGLVTSGPTGIKLGTSYGSSHTKLVLGIDGEADHVTTADWVDAFVNIAMTFDLTTFRVRADGVLIFSTTDLTHFQTVGCGVGSAANDTLFVTDVAHAWYAGADVW